MGKVYFIDCDGTLVDSVNHIKDAVNGYLLKSNVVASNEDWRTLISLGYENTAKIRKYFTGNDITTVATQANNKFEYRDIIDWYIPSVEEMQKLMDSDIWSILSKNFNDNTILWTSNLANTNNAWVYKHANRDNIDDAFRTHSKSASANIMFFGKIKI